MTDSTYVWALIAVMAVGTFLLRLSFIQLYERVDDLPETFERAIELIPVAVLAALVFPRFVLVDGTVSLSAGNPYLIVGVPAAVIAWRTENILLTVVFGLAALWLLQYGL